MALRHLDREKHASQRKWSARAWWVALHVYDYAVLAYSGSLSPDALSMVWFVLVIVVAVANLSSYVILQTSSPGYARELGLSEQPHDLEAGGARAAEPSSDSDLLVHNDSHGAIGGGGGDDTSSRKNDTSGLRFCEFCLLTQPLRTKHW